MTGQARDGVGLQGQDGVLTVTCSGASRGDGVGGDVELCSDSTTPMPSFCPQIVQRPSRPEATVNGGKQPKLFCQRVSTALSLKGRVAGRAITRMASFAHGELRVVAVRVCEGVTIGSTVRDSQVCAKEPDIAKVSLSALHGGGRGGVGVCGRERFGPLMGRGCCGHRGVAGLIADRARFGAAVRGGHAAAGPSRRL